MVGVAQQVEHLVVVQDVAGSSPVTHPELVWCDARGLRVRQHRRRGADSRARHRGCGTLKERVEPDGRGTETRSAADGRAAWSPSWPPSWPTRHRSRSCSSAPSALAVDIVPGLRAGRHLAAAEPSRRDPRQRRRARRALRQAAGTARRRPVRHRAARSRHHPHRRRRHRHPLARVRRRRRQGRACAACWPAGWPPSATSSAR